MGLAGLVEFEFGSVRGFGSVLLLLLLRDFFWPASTPIFVVKNFFKDVSCGSCVRSSNIIMRRNLDLLILFNIVHVPIPIHTTRHIETFLLYFFAFLSLSSKLLHYEFVRCIADVFLSIDSYYLCSYV